MKKNKLFIIGNWKMNPEDRKKAEALFDVLGKRIEKRENIEVVICPPFVYLSIFNFRFSIFKIGAQNCHWKEKGAYTGEISPKMLKSLGVKYVIIGHSERRKYFKETDKIINQKLKAALNAGLIPILCIGEKKGEEREKVISNQLNRDLEGIEKGKIKNLIIAYEPVWAIGTGNFCQPDDAKRANLFIKQILAKIYSSKVAQEIPILYGGSVNSKNAKGYIEKGIEGLLIGGASLDANEFIRIINEVKS